MLAGFSAGFILSLIGIIAEDYKHQISISSALKDLHHFYAPIFIGAFVSFISYLYWRKMQDQNLIWEMLIEDQTRNETMISNISDVIAIINDQGIITYKSPNILKHFGWHPDDLKGSKAWAMTHPEDLGFVQGEFYKLLEKANCTKTIRYRYKCKNGIYKHIQLTATNLIQHPNLRGILCNYRDISEEIKSEQALIENEYKYRTLFENMHDVVAILNNEKQIIDVNSAAFELFEYTKDEIMSMQIENLIYKDDQHISDTYFQKLENTGSYIMYEGRIKTKTGKIKWIQVNATEITKNGKKIGSQDIIRDITQRKKNEIELEEAIKKLHALNATKDKLFTIIAHDLKSPFNSILGFAQLINRNIHTCETEKTEKYLLQIIASSKSTLGLLENMLNWAKNQTGQLSFNPDTIKLSEILDLTLDVLNSAAKIKNISVTCEVNNIEVFADQNMLKTVLLNLISNAIKFTKSGGKIEVIAIEKNNETEITVADNGIGMNKLTRNYLFNPEKNTTTNGTANEKGSGLGLMICKEFIEKHQGKIWVESEAGKGSRFKFTIPVHPYTS